MRSLLLLDGSPRGTRSNSWKMLSRVGEGWTAAGGDAPRVLHLARKADFAEAVAAFGEADCVVLGMPLYTDAMPALVKTFIEELAGRVGRDDNPLVGFLVQSGFSEALHSRALEAYLAKLSTRIGGGYAGTIVHGGGEALQAMPEQASRKLWADLRVLGASLADEGRFDEEALGRVAGVERFSPFMATVMAAASRVRIVNFYWNGQLKKNGAWEKRFAAPYA
jgi:hypothetical protein